MPSHSRSISHECCFECGQISQEAYGEENEMMLVKNLIDDVLPRMMDISQDSVIDIIRYKKWQKAGKWHRIRSTWVPQFFRESLMKNRRVILLALGLAVISQPFPYGEAARKYYPPGFTPPADTSASKTDTAPQVIIQQVPGAKQVIIKTVPGPSVVRVVKPAQSRDPLQLLIAQHRYYDALRMVDARLKKAPNSQSLLMLRAQILREDGNYAQAINEYEGILTKSRARSVKASAWNGMGWTYYQKALEDKKIGDNKSFQLSVQEAESAFRQASQQLPTLAYPWAGLGRIYLETGRLDEAEKVVRKALRLSPNNLAVQLANADLLLAQNKPDDALQSLYGIKKATTTEPEVFFLLAKASLATGKIDDAIINLKQLLELVPDHTEALKLLSQSYELKMKPEDAEEVLEKAIALNPSDVKSVESLLKIYNQRDEIERGNLLLKTLLKNRPEQAIYVQTLLTRLNDAGQWEDAYAEGATLIEAVLSSPGASASEAQLQVSYLFAQSVYQKGRGMLDRRVLQQKPPVLKTRQFMQDHLASISRAGSVDEAAILRDRLAILYIDPLAPLPPLPKAFNLNDDELASAIQMVFLAGNLAQHEQFLNRAKQAANSLDIARQLYNVGDYSGAKVLADAVLAAQPNSLPAKDLNENIAESQQEAEEQLRSLAMLPRRIADSYWQKAAVEALRVGSGDWRTHALLATVLEKRHQPMLALFHQQMAAHYAPSLKDKQYWDRKAERTARNIH
jgi:tetratricopeptide (TPR) repeat protein